MHSKLGFVKHFYIAYTVYAKNDRQTKLMAFPEHVGYSLQKLFGLRWASLLCRLLVKMWLFESLQNCIDNGHEQLPFTCIGNISRHISLQWIFINFCPPLCCHCGGVKILEWCLVLTRLCLGYYINTNCKTEKFVLVSLETKNHLMFREPLQLHILLW